MALNTILYNIARNAALDAGGITALLANGKIQLRTGAQPAAEGAITGTLLATGTFGSPALGAAANGVATANTITQESDAPATNTAGYVALLKADNSTVVATGSVSTTPGDGNLVMASLDITQHNVVSFDSLTITIPAQGA